MTTSTPHSSVSSGTAPRLEIASTTAIAPASFAAAASARTSATTPVDVSECVSSTTRDSRSASREARSSANGISPHSYASRSTSHPYAPAIAAQRSPKEPALTTQTRSPGEQRFAIADSIVPVPLAANSSTSFSVRKTSLSRARHRS